MSDSQDEFGDLMRRLADGSEDAARELLDRYGEHILRVVRRKLNRELRSKFDSVDFVQAVWASFFARPRQRRFDHPQALIAFLVTLAQNKVIDAVRQRLQTQKYNVNRERALDGSVAAEAAGLRAREPTPSQVAVANDEWQRLLADLPARYQRMLVLLREGHTQKDIARELNVNEKTIRRVLEKLNEEPAP
ncbi:MAG TPA: sigma-70 family RNA polymerase sigma factor [Gemmataceae bacterium]|nr:sigma-70 family RNA polymerase sigma factor [Gemmataceae bacterium]